MSKMHPPVELQQLLSTSLIDEALQRNPDSVRAVETHRGNTAHVVAAVNVLYLPDLGLQIIDGKTVPAEGIVNPWNLGHLQRQLTGRYRDGTDEPMPYSSFFATNHVPEDVCVLSNMFTLNFSHFTEELLKIVILERMGFTGPYVYTNLPTFAFEYWDALGLDRQRLMQVPIEPTVFRSALYTTNLNFLDLSKCPDVFFELRGRLLSAASRFSSEFGERLWLDRGTSVSDKEGERRDLVNSEEVDSLLDPYGFTRLDIGGLALLQQVAAARDADVIAGPHGSAFLHCMFMRPRSTVIEIFSPNYLNGYSFEICRVLRHRYLMIADYNAPHDPYPYGMAIHVPPGQLTLALNLLSPVDRTSKVVVPRKTRFGPLAVRAIQLAIQRILSFVRKVRSSDTRGHPSPDGMTSGDGRRPPEVPLGPAGSLSRASATSASSPVPNTVLDAGAAGR